MLSDDMRSELEQLRFNAFCSKYAHKDHIHTLDLKIKFVNILSICVPIAFFALQLIAEDFQKVRVIFKYFGYVASAVLLIMSVIALVQEYQAKLRLHQKFLLENLPVIDEINEILRKPSADEKDFKRLVEKTTSLTKEEEQLLPKLPEEKRQKYYREALKESNIGNHKIKCPVCNSSPWDFLPGACQLCGNTPTASEPQTPKKKGKKS